MEQSNNDSGTLRGRYCIVFPMVAGLGQVAIALTKLIAGPCEGAIHWVILVQQVQRVEIALGCQCPSLNDKTTEPTRMLVT